MYVTARFRNAQQNKDNIEQLCQAVRAAGWNDFSFIRDIENYDPHHFETQEQVWAASLESVRSCDALLIDVSDAPSGGRNVEAGMAFALGMPVYVIVREGVEYKSFYDGIATKVITYTSFKEVTDKLRS